MIHWVSQWTATMQNDFELSRRKALAALGTIGVASAGAGLGTSAYFSDQETFENNSLTAGELDMHIGWESHYSDWSPDEDDGLEGDVTMGNDQPVGLPTQNSSLISVANTSDAQQFLNNTEVDQFPSGTTTFDDAAEMNGCDVLADGADESPVIVDLEDVKPGDFGEVTFSFALCDNPGFVWMNGGLVEARENGLTEPEADDPDEDGPADEVSDDVETSQVELLDAVRTALWYDDGDNLQEGGEAGTTDLDVVLTLDNSNSVSNSAQLSIGDAARAFVNLLSAGSQSAAVAFADGADLLQPLTTDKSAVESALDQYDDPQTEFGTEIGEGIETAQAELDANGNPGADDVIIVLSDGAPFPTNTAGPNTLQQADAAKSAGTRILSIGFELSPGSAEEGYLKSIAGTTPNSETDFNDGSPYDDEGDYFLAPSESELEGAFRDVAGRITEGEEVFFEGTLREALMTLDPDAEANRNQGVPLGGDISAETGGGTGDRNCFSGSGTVHSVGFAWWLPVDHANQIQSDSVAFDIGFYTEQCRHNDGSGMNNAGVDDDEIDDS
jgi:predicted ribosomally synthesized peptide with SipW-like signal peptide